MRARLLDLFCGAGGAAMGYHRAGFDVVGVDIKPQPNYPFTFVQDDVLRMLDVMLDGEQLYIGDDTYLALGDFAAIHASPPCPRYSRISDVHGVRENHPDLVAPTRGLLEAAGLAYVIENVPGAPLLEPTILCGSSFAIGADCQDGKYRQLRRHRLFETSFALMTMPCAHYGEPIGVYGHGGMQAKTVWNGGVNRGYMGSLVECSQAMGIDWMTKAEISQAIPPAYTEFIGQQLLQHLNAAGTPGEATPPNRRTESSVTP